MNIKSLGRRTDMIFNRFAGEIIDRGSYITIRTPSNPNFHWGNYLFFPRPPAAGECEAWSRLFHEEFPYYKGVPGHMLFAWDPGPPLPDCKDFLEKGFILEPGVVLTTSAVNPPPKLDTSAEYRVLTSEDDWDQAFELAILSRDPSHDEVVFRAFKSAQHAMYRRMIKKGLGQQFGAFKDGELVAMLGLFRDHELGRFQNVMTHPGYRRLGLCGTLVYRAAVQALATWKIRELVMEADPDYHAARIYESVGFKPTETNHCLYWVAKK